MSRIVYLYAQWVADERKGIHPDHPFYLDMHHGAHRVTACYEEAHVWIAPLYIEAQEIRVPACALWTVETCGEPTERQCQIES